MTPAERANNRMDSRADVDTMPSVEKANEEAASAAYYEACRGCTECRATEYPDGRVLLEFCAPHAEEYTRRFVHIAGAQAVGLRWTPLDVAHDNCTAAHQSL